MSLKDKRIKSEYRSLIVMWCRIFMFRCFMSQHHISVQWDSFRLQPLSEISKGIADMAKDGGKIEIVASPYLSDDDIQAIKEGYENRQKIIEGALIQSDCLMNMRITILWSA